MLNNFLNFKNETKETHIYRIFPEHRIKEIFNQRKNALVHPEKWDDPFENLVFKSKAKIDDNRTAGFGMRDDFFGQCWTLHRETDAMWRIYSENQTGVKVRTTIGKLFNSLYSTLNDTPDLHCWIGRVEYLTKKVLIEQIQSGFINEVPILNSNGVGLAQTLLIKREEFRHEREVRLLYSKRNKEKKRVHKYEMNPNEVFDQLIFDPRRPDADNLHLVEFFKDNGFTGYIGSSQLYQLPDSLTINFTY